MEPWGANHYTYNVISTPTMSFITPFGMVCTLHFLQCSLRVYFQIQEWKGCSAELQPLEWGWKKSEGKQMPVLTDLPPAPDELL